MSITAQRIRDQLDLFNDASGIRQPAFRAIDVIQEASPVNQILGLATALVAIGEALCINPHDVITKAQRASRDADSPFSREYRAVVAYAQGELA